MIFFNDLLNLKEDDLAKEFLNMQMTYNFPALASECINFIREFKLPDITKEKMGKGLWKQIVKKTIKQQNENELRKDLKTWKK